MSTDSAAGRPFRCDGLMQQGKMADLHRGGRHAAANCLTGCRQRAVGQMSLAVVVVVVQTACLQRFSRLPSQ